MSTSPSFCIRRFPLHKKAHSKIHWKRSFSASKKSQEQETKCLLSFILSQLQQIWKTSPQHPAIIFALKFIEASNCGSASGGPTLVTVGNTLATYLAKTSRNDAGVTASTCSNTSVIGRRLPKWIISLPSPSAEFVVLSAIIICAAL